MTRFQSPDHYAHASDSYQILPFRFLRWEDGDVLLVNMVGEYEFINSTQFHEFATHKLEPSTPEFENFKAKHFLADSVSTLPLQLLATKYRTKMSFLEGFTKLHLFVVTLRCDHSCPYCQVSRVTEERGKFDMSTATADRAIDLMFHSPSEALKVEFQGGEPLLNFDLVTYIVERTEQRNATEQREIEFVIATNLSPLTEKMLAYCKEHNISLSTSLDGPAFLHDHNRPRRGGNSYEHTIMQLQHARAVLGHDRVSALMTTTSQSLQYPREIIDTYVQHGFTSIFLRPISPYGFAVRTNMAFQYAATQFLTFYRTGLAYLIELNRRGTPILEVYTQLLLRKILTPFPTGYVDLQSPAGTGISVVAYNYDGNVYASDEARMLAEMRDTTFCLGNLHELTYDELFGGDTIRALVRASCLQTLPGCTDCAYLPYCGADPIFHWTTQGDPIGHRPTSAFCTKNMGIFNYLFTLLKQADPYTVRLFTSWATEQPAPSVQ